MSQAITGSVSRIHWEKCCEILLTLWHRTLFYVPETKPNQTPTIQSSRDGSWHCLEKICHLYIFAPFHLKDLLNAEKQDIKAAAGNSCLVIFVSIYGKHLQPVITSNALGAVPQVERAGIVACQRPITARAHAAHRCTLCPGNCISIETVKAESVHRYSIQWWKKQHYNKTKAAVLPHAYCVCRDFNKFSDNIEELMCKLSSVTVCARI